jgi:hypothetical protein
VPRLHQPGDRLDGSLVHLNHRDVTLTCFSRAPIEGLAAYKQRMGWQFRYVSTYNSDFAFDFGLALTDEQAQQVPEIKEVIDNPPGWLQGPNPSSPATGGRTSTRNDADRVGFGLPGRSSGGAALAQQGRGRLVGELLAAHAGDEAPAPDKAPGLEAAKRPEDLAPGNGQPFLEVDVAEHDAASQQKLPGDGFGQLVGVVHRLGGGQQRPAALHALPPGAPPAA